MTTAKELYKKIDPFVVDRIRSILTATSTASASGTGTDNAALTAIRDAAIVTVGNTSALNAERALVASGALSFTDGGANGNYTLTMATPGALSVDSGNDASTNHTHAINASSAPGAAAWLLKSASDGSLTLTTLVATTKVTTPIVESASGDILLDPASRIVSVDGRVIARHSSTAVVGAVLQSVQDTDASFTRAVLGYNAYYETAIDLWTIGNVGANDAATFLVRNGSTNIDVIFHASTGNTVRTMDHATFTGGTKFTFKSDGKLGVNNNAPSYELDVTGTGRATTALIAPTVTTTTINSASGDITLAPADDVMLDPASNLVKITSGVSLQSDNYVSQATGWRATYDGQGDFRYLFVDEMHAKSFIADLEQALAGGQIIAKSVAILYSAFTAPAAGGTASLVVRDLPSATGMAVFVNSDYIRIRTFSRSGGSLTIADCWGTVVLDTTYGTSGFDSATKTQRYTFTRSTSTNAGTMTSGTVVAADAIILDYGTSGNGYYEVNAIDGAYGANSPYSQIVTWSGHPRTQTVRARLGNLYGIWSVSGEYGLYAGGGVTDNDSYLRISSNTVRLNNVPLQLYSSGTQKVNIDSTGTNVWIGSDSSNKKLSWNGTTLSVVGDITITGGNAAKVDFSNITATLDAVGDGSTYKRTTANEKTGAGRAFTAINSSNNLVTSVIPASAITPSGAGLYLGSNYMGYYDSSAWKTYIDSSGNFKFLGNASNNYIQWVAASNKLQGVGGGTEQWYASATDGKLYAGAGAVWLDPNGINFNVPTVGGDYIRFISSGSKIGDISFRRASGPIPDANDGMIFTNDNSTKFRFVGALSSEFDHNISITGNISVSGTVDGVDIAAFKSAYDSHNHNSTYLALTGGTLTGTLTSRTITPSTGDTYDIGASGTYYNHLYVRSLHTDTIVGTPSYAHHHDSEYVNVTGDTMSGQLTLAFDNFQMLVLNRTANANVDSTFYVGVSYLTGVSDDYAFLGRSDGIQVFADSSVKINGNTVWHAGNDGAGSGSDADTVDGVHASSFSLTSHNHTGVYVPVGRIVAGGTGLTGGGTLGSDQMISHDDTSSQASVNNSNGTVIQDVTLDGMGHVTALGSVDLDSRYALIGDLSNYVPITRTVSAGAGLTGGGNLSANITISHADTSSQANVTGSGTTFVYGLTFDTYGHVQTVTTSDIGTALDSRFVNVTGDTMTGALLVKPGTNTASAFEVQDSSAAVALSVSTNTGRTGLGRNDPQTRLHVYSTPDEAVRIDSTSATGNPYISFHQNGTRRAFIQSSDSSDNLIIASEYGMLSLKAAATAGTDSDATYFTISAGGAINAYGSVTTTGILTSAANTDGNHTLGRSILGNATATDTASFAHYDHNTSTNYALSQSAAGATKVNSASGQSLDLAIANTSQFTVNTDRILPRSSVVMDIGDYNRKIRTIHAAELAVTTLVAEEVIATIGGQVIVGETTKLIADISSSGTVGGSDALYTNMVAYWSMDETSGTRIDSLNTSPLADKNTVASIGGKLSNSALFVKANSERLTIADSATLSVGDIDFYLSCWVYPTDDDGATHCVLSKGGGSGDRAFALQLDWADNRFEFTVWNSSNVSTVVNSSVTTSVNTWYFVECWHNAATNQIGVSVNTTSTTASHTTGVKDDTSQFTVGSLGFSNYFSGRVDEVYYAKNYIPDSTRRTWLYNSGNARSFVEVFNYGVGAFSIDVEHNFLTTGDYVYMQAAPANVPQFEVFQITSSASTITGGYRYSAIRNLDGTGANNWYIGDAVTSLGGAAGEGYINLTATATIHNHYGPTIAHYVRTGTGTWNAVKPVVASGNLRSFVDYSSDVFGHAAGNDLLLAPDEGFRGYTCDTTNGMRLFNVDLLMYNDSQLTAALDNEIGLNFLTAGIGTTNYAPTSIRWWTNMSVTDISDENAGITCYDSPAYGSFLNISVRPSATGDSSRMQLYALSDTSVAIIALGFISGTPTIELAADEVKVAGNLFAGNSGAHISAAEIWAATGAGLDLCDDAGGVALSVLDSTRYVEIATRLYTNTIAATNGTATTFINAISMSDDLDMNGNDIVDIGILGESWTAPSFNTGWGNLAGYQAVRYKKVGDFVFLRGMAIRNSGSNTTIFTLPSGFRPAADEFFICMSNSNTLARVRVNSSGTVVMEAGDYGWVSLSSVRISTA